MKNAFITFYNLYKDNTVELSNGFTFINHLIDGDHFFIKKDFDKEDLKEKLSSYDKIFVTIVFMDQLMSIVEIIDGRWLLGGRLFTNISQENWKNIVKPDLVYTSTFESYLNKPVSSTLSSYWDNWVKTFHVSCLKYSAICSSTCYWKRCKFCKLSYKEKTNDIERDIISVYNQIPEYNFISVPTLNSGALVPRVLRDLVREIHRNPKKKVLIRLWIRAEEYNLNIFNEIKDLSGLVLNFGLETFSQKANDILGRGLRTKNILHLMKVSIDKGAYVNATYMSRLPFIDTEIFNESMINIQWLKKNINPRGKIYFFDSCDIEWPSEEIAKEFGEYDIKYSDIKSDFSRHSKKIISRLSNEKSLMCSRIMDELSDYNVIKEGDYLYK